MTDITHAQTSDQPPWRLRLEEGDRLELEPRTGPIDDEEGDEAEAPDVVLRLRPWRAHDLSGLLERYNRMVSIFDGAGQGIWREQSLARGLRDARGAATRRPAASADDATRIGEAQRGDRDGCPAGGTAGARPRPAGGRRRRGRLVAGEGRGPRRHQPPSAP